MKYLDQNTQFAPRKTVFGTIRKVPPMEAARWPVYQRRPITSNLRRDWTPDEVDHFVMLIDRGDHYDTVARKLQRSGVALRVKAKRMGIAMTTRSTVLTCAEVARVLGLRCPKKVSDWITRGWLVAKLRGGAAPTQHTTWAVQWDDLMIFLTNPLYWMAWQAEAITDPDLRAEMIALRADQPRWLTPGQVAQRCCVGKGAVNDWIHWGLLPAVRYGNWWIWEKNLEGWVIPAERSRKRTAVLPLYAETGGLHGTSRPTHD